MKRAVAIGVLLLSATGCEGIDSASTATPHAEPITAATPTPVLPAGYDVDLSPAARTRLLRSHASARTTADSCRPASVAVSLVGFDAAAGHRYTSLRIRNAGRSRCALTGVPGIGARGERGTRFRPRVGRGIGPAPGTVVLAPGQVAFSTLEWTGELAAAGAERASLLVVQLAAGQVPTAIPARIAGDGAFAAPLDIGARTTLLLTPWRRGR